MCWRHSRMKPSTAKRLAAGSRLAKRRLIRSEALRGEVNRQDLPGHRTPRFPRSSPCRPLAAVSHSRVRKIQNTNYGTNYFALYSPYSYRSNSIILNQLSAFGKKMPPHGRVSARGVGLAPGEGVPGPLQRRLKPRGVPTLALDRLELAPNLRSEGAGVPRQRVRQESFIF